MGGLPNAPIPGRRVPQTEGLQIGDHRLSTSCLVVERSDHHCGDDLVFHFLCDHTGRSFLVQLVGFALLVVGLLIYHDVIFRPLLVKYNCIRNQQPNNADEANGSYFLHPGISVRSA